MTGRTRRLIQLLAFVAVALAGCAPQHAPAAPASASATPAATPTSPSSPVIRGSVTGPTSASLAWGAMAWVSAATGWAVRGGQIVHTVDGGATWTVQYAGPVVVAGLAAAGGGRAWAVGNSCTAPAGCGGVLLTTGDGGVRWAPVHSFAGLRLLSVSARGRLLVQAGSAVNPSWLLSADGGGTWTPARNPCGGQAFISLPYVLCAEQPGAGNQGKRLLRTPDGGRTWQTVTQVGIGQPEPPGHLQSGGYVSGFFFLDSRRGWVAVSGAAGGIAATADGGETWQPAGPGAPVQGVVAVDFPTATVGYAVVEEAARTLLIATSDAGRAWRQLQPEAEPEPENGVGPALAPRPGHGFVSAGPLLDPFAIMGSNASGRAWTVLGKLPVQAQIASVSFPTAEDGWGVAGLPGTLVRTTDGGRTWQRVQGPADPRLVSFPTATTGFIATGRGELYRTTDGGKSFQRLRATPLTSPTWAIQFITATDGWSIQARSLTHTADGGRTWRQVAIPGGLRPQALSFSDADHGVVLSTDCLSNRPCTAHFIVTADGGRTWRVIAVSGLDLRPVAVAFASPSQGIFMTDEDVLYTTADGGRTWSRAP